MKEQKPQAPAKGLTPMLIGIIAISVVAALAIGIAAGQYLAGSKKPAASASAGLSQSSMDQLKAGLAEAQKKQVEELFGQLKEAIGERRIMDVGSLPVQLFDISGTGQLASKGPQNAVITLVEFSDFQCPFCGRMAQALEDLMKKHPDQIRLIFVDRPLVAERNGFPFHPYAYLAHEAAAAAGAQGKFWEMYNYIFAHQQEIFPANPTSQEDYAAKQAQLREKLAKIATDLGMDGARLKADLDSHAHKARLDATIGVADRLNINSTPTVFMNAYFRMSDPGLADTLLGAVKKIQ